VEPQQILSRLREQTSHFSVTQLASMALVFVLVVGVVAGSAWWLNTPDYVLLYDDMDAESASDMVNRLRALNVRYQLDPGGRAIRVPRDRVDELRLDLAATGLPSSGRIGFEIFDRTSFGATEFIEKVNYRRALEGEIARTIASLAEVSSARVHIAMGRDSLFGESRPAKASVVLTLRGTRPMPAATTAGIANLVAASVEGLRPDAVVVLDSRGRALSRPADDSDLPGVHLERQQRMEHEMATRVVGLLAPVVGADRVRVNVALTLDAQSRQETEERWDPETVVRSRQVSLDAVTTAGPASGVAGSRGNMPPPAAADQASAAPAAAAGSESTRNTETVNYEISRTTRQVIRPPGDIARISVAVIVDDGQTTRAGEDGRMQVVRVRRGADDLQKLHDLVAAAVGLDPARGDRLTVQNVPFEDMVFDDPEPAGVLARYAVPIQEGGRLITTLLIALAAFLLIGRPLLQRAGVRARPAAPVEDTPAASVAAPRTVADLERELEAQLDAAAADRAGGHRLLPVLTRKAAGFAEREPAGTARLLRSWMHEGER
jgi:flagellar M-ring protein FliF